MAFVPEGQADPAARHEVPAPQCRQAPVPEGRSKSWSDDICRRNRDSHAALKHQVSLLKGMLAPNLEPEISFNRSHWDGAIFFIDSRHFVALASICCPTGTKYIVPVEALIKLVSAYASETPGSVLETLRLTGTGIKCPTLAFR